MCDFIQSFSFIAAMIRSHQQFIPDYDHNTIFDRSGYREPIGSTLLNLKHSAIDMFEVFRTPGIDQNETP